MNTATRIELTQLTPEDPLANAPAVPIKLDFESQLFIDDHLIESSRSLHRRVNRPVKQAEPILEAKEHWEGIGLCFGTVIEDNGAIRLYYRPLFPNGVKHVELRAKCGYTKSSVCLAESSDGFHFTRTYLEKGPIPGTNILINEALDDFSIIKDETETDPAARYKILSSYQDWPKGLTSGISADGVNWDFPRQSYTIANLGDRCALWYDPRKKEYVAWSRCYPTHPDRLIFQRQTSNFDDWTDPERNGPWQALAPDREDPIGTWCYGGYAFWYRSLYIGYLELYHMQHQRVDTQLICSRDGKNWQRVGNRELFMANGEEGTFDSFWTVPTFNAPIHRDGQMLIHFEGRPDPHVNEGFRHTNPGLSGALGVATLREDGFVSLDATGNDGILLTRLLEAPEGARGLAINAAPFVRRPGYEPMRIDVELLSGQGDVLEAHRFEVPNNDMTLWRHLSWETALPSPLRLRLRLRNARLYSFRFTD